MLTFLAIHVCHAKGSRTAESFPAKVPTGAGSWRQVGSALRRCGWILGGGLLTVFLGVAASSLGAEGPEALFHRWLNAQTNVHSLAAEFVQTRTLRSLAQPVVTPGRLYFSAPAQFRWELGAPPQSIALRQSNQLWVIYPPQKRAELYPLQEAGGRWREMLALLEAGFPRTRAEVEARYRVEKAAWSNGVVLVTLTPRQSAARRLMPEVSLGLMPEENRLRFTVLKMADGSQIRQDYTNMVINPLWPESPFTWTRPADYEVVEPLSRRRKTP